MCGCVPFALNVTGISVALKLVVKEVRGKKIPTSAGSIKRMASALAKTLTEKCDGLRVDIAAVFMYQSSEDERLWCIARVYTIQGYDTKSSVRNLADHLEGPPFSQLTFANNVIEIRLSNNISFWRDINRDLAAKDLFNNATLKLLYQNEAMNDRTYGLSLYQELSPLLFCKQVQLNESQFSERDGIVTLNVSSVVYDTVNFCHVTQSQIRICAAEFLKAFTASSTRQALSLGPSVGLVLWHILV